MAEDEAQSKRPSGDKARFQALGEAFEQAVDHWLQALWQAASPEGAPSPAAAAGAEALARGLDPDGTAQAVLDLYGLPGLLLSLGLTPERKWRLESEWALDWWERRARALVHIVAADADKPRRSATLFFTLRNRRWRVHDIWPADQQGDTLQTQTLPPAVRRCFRQPPPVPPAGPGLRDEVERHLAPVLHGFGVHQAALGLRLWRDYKKKVRAPEGRANTLAAAVTYALVRVTGQPARQAEVASMFDVSSGAVAHRFAQVRDALRLTYYDRRYTDDRPFAQVDAAVAMLGLGPTPDLRL